MTTSRYFLCFSTCLLFAALHAQPALGQSGPVSVSPADIPPTGVFVNGKPARANLLTTFVQVSSVDQRVWFGIDTAPGTPKIFYNRRVYNVSTGQWQWWYPESIAVISFPEGSMAVSDVLHSATPDFRDRDTGYWWHFVMYLAPQPGACDGKRAAFLMVAFSNDGINWTPPKYADYPTGTPQHDCGTDSFWAISVEAAGAVYDGSSKIYVVAVEGNVEMLVQRNLMSSTQTYVGSADRSDPRRITIIGQLTNNGMFNPKPSGQTNDRFESYQYFLNLGVAYDEPTGTLYIGRSYPYPYDRGWNGNSNDGPAGDPNSIWRDITSCGTQLSTCGSGRAMLTNRIQVYKMHIGSLSNIGSITTSNYYAGWQLVTDTGRQSGYMNTLLNSWTCQVTPLIAGQANNGHDYASTSFGRDGRGRLLSVGNQGWLLAGDSFKLSRSQGACVTTGDEKTNYQLFTK